MIGYPFWLHHHYSTPYSPNNYNYSYQITEEPEYSPSSPIYFERQKGKHLADYRRKFQKSKD